MVGLVTPGQIGGATLAPDITGGLARGQQLGLQQQQLEANRFALEQQQQQQQAAQQQAQLAAQQQQQAQSLVRRQQAGEQIQTGAELAQLFVDNPDLAGRVLQSAGISSEFQKNDAAEFGFLLENTPVEKRQQLIQRRAETVQARGGDPKDSLALLNASPDRQNQTARMLQLAALNPQEREKIAQQGREFGLKERQLAQQAELTREGITSRERIASAQLSARDSRTSAAKNAIEAGLTRGTPEYQEFIRDQVTKAGTVVNLQGQEKSFQKELGKKQAIKFQEISDEGDSAQAALEAVDRMVALDPRTGALEEFKVNTARVAKAFGLEDISSAIADVPTAEAFRAESQKAVNAILLEAKGVQTEGDAQRALKTVANLGNDPRSNTFISNALKGTSLRQIQRKEFFESQLEEGDSFNEMSRAWSKKINNFPNLSSRLKTQDGLPMFFHQFVTHARGKDPNITDSQVESAWRQFHGK